MFDNERACGSNSLSLAISFLILREKEIAQPGCDFQDGKMKSNQKDTLKTNNCQSERGKVIPPVSASIEIEPIRKEVSTHTLDIIEITSEFHDYDEDEDDTENASIQIADFADSFSISYQDTSFHFELSGIKDPLTLAKMLKDSFHFACSHNYYRPAR